MKLTALTTDVYFVTLTIIDWVDIFTRPLYKNLITDNLEYIRKNKSVEIYAYVIMTNHVHLLMRSCEKPLSDILRDFKTFTSKELYKSIKDNAQESRATWMLHLFETAGKANKLNKNFQIWQNNSQPVFIKNPEQFDIKRNYIHNNPVRAGIVSNPSDYLYSSACPDSPLCCDEV